MEQNNIITIAFADDHAMFRHGLISVFNNYPELSVLFEAPNGKELVQQIKASKEKPNVCILDINMPIMHGYDAAKTLRRLYPNMKILALSMYGDERNIIEMLKCGANGYILKDDEPNVLIDAIKTVHKVGFYTSKLITDDIMSTVKAMHEYDTQQQHVVSGKELEFLKFACSEMTYKEIATTMDVSERTIDGYRDKLFDKLKVKSRIGLVIYAIRAGIVHYY